MPSAVSPPRNKAKSKYKRHKANGKGTRPKAKTKGRSQRQGLKERQRQRQKAKGNKITRPRAKPKVKVRVKERPKVNPKASLRIMTNLRGLGKIVTAKDGKPHNKKVKATAKKVSLRANIKERANARVKVKAMEKMANIKVKEVNLRIRIITEKARNLIRGVMKENGPLVTQPQPLGLANNSRRRMENGYPILLLTYANDTYEVTALMVRTANIFTSGRNVTLSDQVIRVN